MEGPREVQVALGGHSDGVQVRLGWPKRRPRAPKSAPRGVQRLQEAAKSLQVGSARRPRALQEAPKKLQVGSTRRPRGSKSCPRRSKRRPRGSKLGSKDVQERSKSYKTAVQAQFDSKQRHPAKSEVFSRFSQGKLTILQVRSALEGQLERKLELVLAVQSPTWSSEGHLGALGEQFEGPTGAQDAPRAA